MTKFALKGKVVLPDRVLEGGLIVVEGEKIAAVLSLKERGQLKESDVRDYGQNFIAPGLIDLHVHGARGKDVMDGNVDSLAQIALHQAHCGVTGFVPTTLTAALPSILKAIEAVKAAKIKPLAAEILGLHLEGPFLSPKKKGAQNPDFIREINDNEISLLSEAAGGLKTIITSAPEFGDNIKYISSLKKKGLIISIGHSEATYELARQSFEQGVTHATHLFNAMSGFLPREPGVIGAVLDSAAVTAEIIADGFHVHPASLRIAIRQKGVGGICLITDSMNAVGLGEGDYRVGSLDVVVKNGQARLKGDDTLAGSILTLNKAVHNIIQWTGLPVNQAVAMASLNPARILGLEENIGSVAAGKLANLAVFDEHFDVVDTILRGRSVLRGTFGI